MCLRRAIGCCLRSTTRARRRSRRRFSVGLGRRDLFARLRRLRHGIRRCDLRCRVRHLHFDAATDEQDRRGHVQRSDRPHAEFYPHVQRISRQQGRRRQRHRLRSTERRLGRRRLWRWRRTFARSKWDRQRLGNQPRYVQKTSADPTADHTDFFDTDAAAGTALTKAKSLPQPRRTRKWHNVKVSWDAGTQTLTYWVDGKKGRNDHRRSRKSVFNGSDYVHFGFTGATAGGKINNLQQVKVTSVDATYAPADAHADRHRANRFNRADERQPPVSTQTSKFSP